MALVRGGVTASQYVTYQGLCVVGVVACKDPGGDQGAACPGRSWTKPWLGWPGTATDRIGTRKQRFVDQARFRTTGQWG